MKKRIVLDYDGTLVDCSARDYHLYVDIMADLMRPALTFQEYWPLRRQPMNIKDLIAMTAPDKVQEFLAMRLDRHELRGYLKHDKPFKDTIPTLIAFRQRFELHLVSARFYQSNLCEELAELGLYNLLDSVTAAKSSDKYEAIKSLGTDVVAVIGDTEHDINPAKMLGITAAGVTTGIRSREFLTSIGADRVVDTLGDALVTMAGC